MNLKETYQGWQQMQENRELYAKTREAFRKAWFTLPTNKPCSYYTKEVLGEALAATREVESNKAKAASVICHVLTFANWAEPDYNPKPDFSYHDLMEYTKGPLANPEKIASNKEPESEDTDDSRDPLAGIDFSDGTKTEEDMKEKKQRGKQPKPEEKKQTKKMREKKIAANDALEVFTDDELLEELDRRGWTGELRRMQVVSIGERS